MINKIIFLLAVLPSLAFAEYGGADKYPVQTKTGGSYIVSATSINFTQDYDALNKAEYSAISLSIKCGCEVTLTSPVVKFKTEWKAASSAKSSSSASSKAASSSSAKSSASSSSVPKTAYIEWQEPSFEQNIDSYIIRQKNLKDKNFVIHYIKAPANKFYIDESKGLILFIASQAVGGMTSDYVSITAKQVII